MCREVAAGLKSRSGMYVERYVVRGIPVRHFSIIPGRRLDVIWLDLAIYSATFQLSVPRKKIRGWEKKNTKKKIKKKK